MLPLIVKIINTSLLTFVGFLIMKDIINKKIYTSQLYIILSMIILLLPACVLFEIKYSSLLVLSTYILDVLVYKRLYNIKFQTAIISCGIMMLYLAIADLIVTSVNVQIVSYNDVRTVWYISLLNNIIVSIIAYVISKFKVLKSKVQLTCKKAEAKNDYNTVLFIILSIIAIVILFYNITTIFKLNTYYKITLIVASIIVFLYYFYLQEHLSYEKLNEEYNMLFKHVETFEDLVDNEQMYRHELKNNLSIIRNSTKSKKIINKIDDMLKISMIIDDEYVVLLNNLPKGDLKGLLYYKIAVATQKNTKLIIEISPLIKKDLERLSEKSLRELCMLLGIYLDNAIEASSESNKKCVTLEIYGINNELNFVISNTYNNFIPLKVINKKGYSSKGIGHGNGLYYANKIIKRNKKITAEAVYLNNYYIQKIIISID